MRRKQNSNTSSTISEKVGSTASAQTQPASPIQWSYHSLPLNLFIDQVEDGTVQPDIYNTFFESIKDKQQKYITKLIQKINLAQSKYDLIKTAVTYFQAAKQLGVVEFDAEVLNVLKQHINIRDTDSADTILSRAAKFLTDLELLKHELNKISPPTEDGVKVDRSFFTHLIIAVSKHMKAFIDKRLVSVGEFAEMINDMRAEQDAVRSQYNTKRHAR